MDDTKYKLDPGKTLWDNSRYLTWNDKGADGGLKVSSLVSKSAYGVSVSMDSVGSIMYKAPSGWQGKDILTYTVRDADGSTDTVSINDLTGTELSQINVDLGGTLGGTVGDSAADAVVVNGTNGNDVVASAAPSHAHA